MKILKDISDELWLGLVFMLSSVWLYAMKPSYLIISGVFMLVGIILLVIDSVRSTQEKYNDETHKNEENGKKIKE